MVWPRGLAPFLDRRQHLPWKARPFPGPPPAPPLKGSVPAGDPPEHGDRAASTSEQDVLHKLRQVFGHLSMPANHHHEFPHETLLLRDVLLTGESSPPNQPVGRSGERGRSLTKSDFKNHLLPIHWSQDPPATPSRAKPAAHPRSHDRSLSPAGAAR